MVKTNAMNTQGDTIYHTFVLGKKFAFIAAIDCSFLGFNALVASLLCRKGKQGIKSKAEAIKCCKER